MIEKRKKMIIIASRMLTLVYIVILIWLIMFKSRFHMIERMLSDWSLDRLAMHFKHSINFIPLKTIAVYAEAYTGDTINLNIILYNVFGNIVAFIPFGFLLPLVNSTYWSVKRLLKVAAIFIIAIESFQLIATIGSFDIDDFILNILGVIIGFIILNITNNILRKIEKTKKDELESI